MADWRESTWGDEISLEYGKGLRGYADGDGPVRVYGTNGPVGWTDTPLADGPGVILGRKGAYRGVEFCSEPFFVIDTAYYLVPKTDLDMRWLYYAVIYYELGLIDDGSPVPSTTRAAVYARGLRVPPHSEQVAIARVLGALDDKIESNRGLAERVRRYAGETFRAWFVEFEAVRAHREGASSYPGMPPALFESMEETFVSSDVGSIPRGWEVRPLDKIASFLNGLALQKFPPRGDGTDLPVIKIAQLRKGSTSGSSLANADVPRKYVVADGDLVFSWSGSLMVDLWYGGEGALNQHLFKVSSADYPDWFCLHWISEHLPWFQSVAAGKATTMGHINRAHLGEAMVVVPPSGIIEAADEIFDVLYGLYDALMLESRALENVRDVLLPKLMSEEASVDVQRVAEICDV